MSNAIKCMYYDFLKFGKIFRYSGNGVWEYKSFSLNGWVPARSKVIPEVLEYYEEYGVK